MSDADDRVTKALEILVEWGSIYGDHHKRWVIDQAVRALTGCPTVRVDAIDAHEEPYDYLRQGESAEYLELIARAKAGGEGPDTYEWDEGIAP